MAFTDTAKRIRDSRTATAIAFVFVLLSQVPSVGAVTGVFSVGSSLVLVACWLFGALVWLLYTAVHLFAPLADVRRHPNRDSWGPFRTANMYTYFSATQLWIRLSHGVLGLVVGFVGIFVFLLTSPPFLLVIPSALFLLAVVLLSTHIGLGEPSDTIRREG